MNGAIGALVLLILINNIDEVAGWVMRIAVSRNYTQVANNLIEHD
jgi:hypothetical protein